MICRVRMSRNHVRFADTGELPRVTSRRIEIGEVGMKSYGAGTTDGEAVEAEGDRMSRSTGVSLSSLELLFARELDILTPSQRTEVLAGVLLTERLSRVGMRVRFAAGDEHARQMMTEVNSHEAALGQVTIHVAQLLYGQREILRAIRAADAYIVEHTCSGAAHSAAAAAAASPITL